MSRKKPYQDQIDSLCTQLGITKPQYDEKTTISELEEIIDKLEAQLPDDESESGEQTLETESTIESSPALIEEPSVAVEEQPANTSVEVKVYAADEMPNGENLNGEENTDSAGDVEVNSDEAGDVEVEATRTFRCNSHGERLTVLRGTRVFLPEDVANDAVCNDAACFIGCLKA